MSERLTGMQPPDSSAISLRGVTKIYRAYPTPRHRLFELLSAGRKRYFRETHALDNITFSLEKGARLGIVGENGSGKSTLLKILAGVLTPNAGLFSVNGRVSALLELGAGFNPDLTGRDNIAQFCMLHGMRREEIEQARPDIIAFSELRDAIEQPVKTYSSGMAIRLGFACAVYVRPDILIVDEALSVGDAYFQNKCLHKIRSMLDTGVTFIYVTHAADSVRSLCNQGLWLDKGRMRMLGTARDVGTAYQADVFSRLVRADFAGPRPKAGVETSMEEAAPHSAVHARRLAFAERVAPLRTGSGEILVDDIVLIDETGQETDQLPFESESLVRVFFHSVQPTPGRVAITLGVMDRSGRQILHFNSLTHKIDLATLPHGQHYAVDIRFKCPLTPGEYSLASGITLMTNAPTTNAQMIIEHVIDYCNGGSRFTVLSPDKPDHRDLWGVCYVDCEISLTPIS